MVLPVVAARFLRVPRGGVLVGDVRALRLAAEAACARRQAALGGVEVVRGALPVPRERRLHFRLRLKLMRLGLGAVAEFGRVPLLALEVHT